MITKLSPIESEFATAEEAEAYDVWFRAKVQASMDDSRPSIPHDQVMAEMDVIIAEAEQRHRVTAAHIDVMDVLHTRQQYP
jgi:hypothetical protein